MTIQEQLKCALAKVPGAVAIVATQTAEGAPVGLTVTSFAALSLEPPLILFSIDHRSRSVGPLTQRRHFSVNVLAEHQSHLARILSSKDDDKWNRLAYTVTDREVPMPTGCVATFECERYDVRPAGDHLIIIGRVTSCAREHGALPLLYCDRQYQQLGATI
jgi:flavin reductase (DIM6/NTAB) family NADH-FMN oxidoreductase RutF